ncbi:MAG: DUF2067 family protein [Candidatus Kariarchaeaceae archaeon]|jgi:hypothetical protein
MSRRSKVHSRKLVIKPASPEDRSLFLELSAPMLNEISAKITSSLNRIEMEIIGEFDQVDRLITQLRGLENMIYTAIHPDKNFQYAYHANLLSKLYSPPVNLDLYASALGVFGHRSETQNEQLVTTATMDIVEDVHDKIVVLRNQIEGQLNRDIERFAICIALELESKAIEQIVEIAFRDEIFVENEYGQQFGMSPSKARKILLEKMGVEGIEDPDLLDMPTDFSMKDFGFEGGKLVFLKDGRQLDESELEFEEGTESQ